MAEEYFVVIEEKLNLVPGMWAPLRVHVKQYDGDYTRQMKFTLYNGESIYTIPKGTKIVLCGTKRDGTGFSYTGTFYGSVVTVPLMRQMTIVSGTVPCEILLLDEQDNQIGSATFILDVDRAALQDDTLQSSNDFQTLLSYLEGSKYYEQLSESYAIGRTGIRDGENTDNSKYYSLKARSYALAAASYVGSPLIATTASEMTDHSRIYVYKGSESGYTSGNWYYYDTNTSTWKAGGIYQSEASLIKTYTTIEAMQSDAALHAGMTAIVLGNDLYNDGNAGTYYIRALDSGESANGYSTYSLVDASLCAERADIQLPFVTPEMYGAKGDGSTDDSAAIQRAVDTGNTVVFSAKTYKVGSTIKLLSNQSIRGAGQKTVLKTTGGISVLQINCQNRQTKVNVQISDLKILGAGSGTGNGIDFAGDDVNDISDYHTIHNVYIEGFRCGIRITGRAIYCRFDCIDIWRCTFGIYANTECFNTNVFIQVRIILSGEMGINLLVSDGSQQKNKGCTFLNCSIEQTAKSSTKNGAGAITIQNSENNRIINCWLEGNFENVTYSDATSDLMSNNADISFTGILCYKNIIEGCVFQRTGGSSIKINTTATAYNRIGINEFQSKCAYDVVSNNSTNSQLYSAVTTSDCNLYVAGSGDHNSFVYSPYARGYVFLNSSNSNTVFDGINNKYITKQITSNFTVTEIKGGPGCELTIECVAGGTGAKLTLPNSLGTLSNGETKKLMYLGYPKNAWVAI